MREIHMQIIGYEVKKTSGCAGIQGEGNATSLLISFGEDWDGMAKKLTWINALGQDPVVRTLTADLLVDLADNTRLYRTVIPPEPLAYAGECTMVVDGYTDGVRARSVAVRLLVKHAPIVPSDPTDPTPTQAEQLQAQIDTLLEDMSEQAGIAQAGAATATQKAAEATASAATAASSAQGAEKSAAAAGNSETAAKTSESNAKASETAAAASASSASASAQTAAAKAGEASASASSAAQSAQTAQTSAGTAQAAQVAAETAKTGAETAKTGAETAKTGAETAKTGAETARDQAQTACATATSKAGEAQQSANAAVDAAEAISAYGTSVDVVLTAAGWTGTAAPYTQTVTVAGLLADSFGEIGLSQGATDAQRAAARAALLSIQSQTDGAVTLIADGDKPTVDLPCTANFGGVVESGTVTPDKTDFLFYVDTSPVETTFTGSGYRKVTSDFIDIQNVNTLYARLSTTSQPGGSLDYYNAAETLLLTENLEHDESYRELRALGGGGWDVRFTLDLQAGKALGAVSVKVSVTGFDGGADTVRLFTSREGMLGEEDRLRYTDKYGEAPIADGSVTLEKTNFARWTSPNLLNFLKFRSEGIAGNPGALQFGQYMNYFTEYVDVSEHKTLYLRLARNANVYGAETLNVACYDAEKNYLYTANRDEGHTVSFSTLRDIGTYGNPVSFADGQAASVIFVEQFTVPEEAAFIRLSTPAGASNVKDYLWPYSILSYSDILDLTALPEQYEQEVDPDFRALVERIAHQAPAAKTMVMVGDSLTNWGGGNDEADGFLKYVHDRTGVLTTNEGTAGATWQTGDGQGGCGVNRVNQIVSDGRHYDLYCFLLGTNGGSSTDTGESSADPSTMCGAIRYCMETLIAYDPTALILICLPPQREEGNGAQEQVNAVIESIARHYSVPTLDLYHRAGVLPDTVVDGTGYLSDVVHLGANGIARVGIILAAEVAYWLG